MTLQELWQLFPIVLVPHDPRWKEWANEEMESLRTILSDFNPAIHHIGSTAIPGIMAKPIVDLLVEMPPAADWEAVKAVMQAGGYICMSQGERRLSFNKGYTPEGYAERVFHVHVARSGDNPEIAFRDYLLSHPAAAREYEALKLSLLPALRHDRDAYTAAKSPFIARINTAAH